MLDSVEDVVRLLGLLGGSLRGRSLGALGGHRLGILDFIELDNSGVCIYRNTYMSLIPLPERCSIDLDDAALDKGIGTDKFVV